MKNKLTSREREFLKLQNISDKGIIKTIAHYLKFLRNLYRESKPKEKQNANDLEKMFALTDSVFVEPIKTDDGKVKSMNDIIALRGGVTVIVPNLMFKWKILIKRGKNCFSWNGKSPDIEIAYKLWDGNNNKVQKKYKETSKKESVQKKKQYKIAMDKKHTVIAVEVIESERGWGSKIDDYMVCLSVEDAKKWAEEFNSKNTESNAPDWYMRADDSNPIDITDKQMKVLKKEKDKRMWLSQLKK